MEQNHAHPSFDLAPFVCKLPAVHLGLTEYTPCWTYDSLLHMCRLVPICGTGDSHWAVS